MYEIGNVVRRSLDGKAIERKLEFFFSFADSRSKFKWYVRNSVQTQNLDINLFSFRLQRVSNTTTVCMFDFQICHFFITFYMFFNPFSPNMYLLHFYVSTVQDPQELFTIPWQW